jgi:hypothetical protein
MVSTKSTTAAGWRVFVATLALIAFAFQGYISQTHVHVQLAGLAVSNVAAVKHSASDAACSQHAPDKTPAREDPMKCPLCQVVGYAGHFVTPSAAASLLLPRTAISILPLAIALLSPRESPSHIWQGRGPPHS